VRRVLPVLIYHGIHTGPAAPGVFDSTYSITTDQFRAQLDWLAGNGFTTVLLDTGPRRPGEVVLTFDDGDVSVLDVALPLLTERGMVAEFCITSDFVGRPGRIDRAAVRTLAECGMAIESHGRTHRHLADLSPAELREELVSSRRRLEDWSGRPVRALSVPGGRAGRREYLAARQAGYRWVLNSVPGPNHQPERERYLNRLTVTRATTVGRFAQLVRWRGSEPRRVTVRTALLEVPKRVLGNARYTRVRAALRG
jgi:peptidoglycan/xylan/chitin deacetylase (PgdA/CDA1 family)